MTELYQPVNHHERLIEQLGRPYIKNCPAVYEPLQNLVEAENRGEHVSEAEAFQTYFERMQERDPDYMLQITRMADNFETAFPEGVEGLANRRLQMVVPAYREGENMDNFLKVVKDQWDQSDQKDWGVTFVIDHAIPYKNGYETGARKQMQQAVDTFLKQNPEMKPYVNYVFYTRRKDTAEAVLPVGLARKVGEDVLMYQRLKAQTGQDAKPLYFGLMDIDTGNLTPGILAEMAASTAESATDRPRVIRARGSFDHADVQENLQLHPLQMMWEGATSAVGRNTKHNPFNIGRLSAAPAREVAITGGGFARRLEFPDEDIRHGIQIRWQLDNIDTVEIIGKYSTSPRREINTVNSILAMLESNGGVFDLETMECSALIRMYGNWDQHTFRRHLGNVGNDDNGSAAEQFDPMNTDEHFNQAVPRELIEAMANAFFRFTTFSIHAVDELSASDLVPEVQELRAKFLRGEMPYFRVQLNTLDIIRTIATQQPERFESLKPLLARVDEQARKSVSQILGENGVAFDITDQEPIYGIIEQPEPGLERDRTILRAPFTIRADQTGYRKHIKEELGV